MLFCLGWKRLWGRRRGWGQSLPQSQARITQPSLGFPLAGAAAALRSPTCALCSQILFTQILQSYIKPSVWYVVDFPSGPTAHYISLCVHRKSSPLEGGCYFIWPFLWLKKTCGLLKRLLCPPPQTRTLPEAGTSRNVYESHRLVILIPCCLGSPV